MKASSLSFCIDRRVEKNTQRSGDGRERARWGLTCLNDPAALIVLDASVAINVTASGYAQMSFARLTARWLSTS